MASNQKPTIKTKNKPLILLVMKTHLHLSDKTKNTLLFIFAYSSFVLMIIGAAIGKDILKLF